MLIVVCYLFTFRKFQSERKRILLDFDVIEGKMKGADVVPDPDVSCVLEYKMSRLSASGDQASSTAQ